jgi:sugar lactone lactonase YvrE
MRICLIFPLALITLPLVSQTKNTAWKKTWESEKQFRVPESVLFDKTANILFVSNIDGKPLEKDGAGFISRVSPEGKIAQLEWVSGLNAPKGMGMQRGMLYVTDIDEVVSIDIKSGAIVLRTPVEGAKFLNDIAISEDGVVYISDMGTGRIHKLVEGKVTLYIEGLEGVNGLAFSEQDLYALANGTLYHIKSATERIKIAQGMDDSSDGLVVAADKSFFASSWAGVVYHISAKGKVEKLLDTREQKLNTADIGIDSDKKQIYVPTFFGNTVAAYGY